MTKNSYPKKITSQISRKNWFSSLEGKPIFQRKKDVRFIVFDSLDGAGNSTQVKLLNNYLNKNKKKTAITKEPTSELIGGLIKSQLSHNWESSALCLQLLFSADRAYHLEKQIIPLLKKGISVISDRYFFSTIAYGAVEIKNFDWLIEINKYFLFPDFTFFLKVRPKTCIKRIKNTRFETDIYEKEEILRKVWKNYQKLAKMFDNIYIIDGESSPKTIAKKIQKIIE